MTCEKWSKDEPFVERKRAKMMQGRAERTEKTACPEGGDLPRNGLLGMCRGMGPHFQDSIDYNGVVFSSFFNRVTRIGSHFFETLRVRKFFAQN